MCVGIRLHFVSLYFPGVTRMVKNPMLYWNISRTTRYNTINHNIIFEVNIPNTYSVLLCM